MAFVVLILFLFLIGLIELSSDRKSHLVRGLLLVVFIWFVGLKSQGGTDFMSYKHLYDTFHWETALTTLIEPLYVILNLVCKTIWDNFYFFWFVVAIINMNLKFSIFSRYSPFLCAALLIYCAGMFIERDFDGVRQGLAIAICYMSLPYVLKDRLWPFLLITLSALFIHSTALLFFILYPIRKLEIPPVWIYAVVGAGLLFAMSGMSIINLVSGIIPSEFLRERFERYGSSDVYGAESGINIGLVFRIGILMLFVFLRKYIKIEERLYLMLRNGFLTAIMFSLLFHDFQILSHRLPYAFREFQIMIIPSFLTITNDKKGRLLIFCLIFLYALVLMLRVMSGENAEAYMKYDNWLFDIFR